MTYTATIILEDGTKVSLDTWQKIYGLPVGTSKIGRFFSIGEPSFARGLEIAAAVIRIIDKLRELKGQAININSLDRTPEKQSSLKASGLRAATTSPHVYKMAADVDTVSKTDTYLTVKLLKQAAASLSIKIRIGYLAYLSEGQTFVHFDVCPHYYGHGGCYEYVNVPMPWRNEITW